MVESYRDFTDFRPLVSEESGSEEEEVDSDVRDTIYAHMFFTSSATPQVKESVAGLQQKPAASGDVSVSLLVGENDKFPTRLKASLKNMSRRELKAFRKHRREKRKLKRNLMLSDSSSSDVSLTDSPARAPTYTESPLATSDLRANGAPAIERGSDNSRIKGSTASSDPQDVIVISDSDPHTVITISSGENCSDSDDSLNFDAMVDLLDREDSKDDMELCDKEDLDQEGISDDWAISKKDLLGREAYERLFEKSLGDRPGRYYNDKLSLKCTNCKQRGHSNKNCPWPKRHQVCHICASVNHMSSRCPQAMCSYCYQPQHRGRPCSGPCGRPVDCNRCYMQGHHASICPDQWRQFHNTNYTHEEIVTTHPRNQRSASKVFCYNCAESGHYGFECTKTRPRGCFRPHTPLIAKYNLDLWPPWNVHHIRRALCLPTVDHDQSHSSGASSHHRQQHHSFSEPGYSRKRPPQDPIREDYATPPSRKHSKRRQSDHPRPSNLRDDINQYNKTNGYTQGSSSRGHHGNRSPLLHHQESEPDLRLLLDSREGSERYRSHDFPRTPLQPPHRRESYPVHLLPPPSPHAHAPPLLTPSHRHQPLLPSPHQHHRRFSDNPDLDRRSHDQTRRSHDPYLPPYRREEREYYTSERGFRGSPQTAWMLNKHEPKRSRHYRH